MVEPMMEENVGTKLHVKVFRKLVVVTRSFTETFTTFPHAFQACSSNLTIALPILGEAGVLEVLEHLNDRVPYYF